MAGKRINSEAKSIGRLIDILQRASLIFFQKKAKPLGLSYGQFKIIHIITKHPGIAQHDIQKHYHLDRGSVSVLIKGLESNGFIIIKMDQNDKRATCIFPTKKTEELKIEIQQILEQWTDNLLKDFTPGERLLSFELLERMIQNVKAHD